MEILKRNIAIVCGGDSSEHDVSIRSAQGLYSFFDKERYNVYVVDVKKNDWHVNFTDGSIAKIDKNDFSFQQDGHKVTSTMPTLPFMALRARTELYKATLNCSTFLTAPVACWLRQ